MNATRVRVANPIWQAFPFMPPLPKVAKATARGTNPSSEPRRNARKGTLQLPQNRLMRVELEKGKSLMYRTHQKALSWNRLCQSFDFSPACRSTTRARRNLPA